MKKIINNLRQKPEKVRRHILHVAMIVLGVILFFIWVFTLGTNLTDQDTQVKIKNDLEPLSALKDNLINGYKSIQDNPLNDGE